MLEISFNPQCSNIYGSQACRETDHEHEKVKNERFLSDRFHSE